MDGSRGHLLRVLVALERFEKQVGQDWAKVNLPARKMFDELTEAREDAATFLIERARGVGIVQPVGNCDGSREYAYDATTVDGRGEKLLVRCPGCRACS